MHAESDLIHRCRTGDRQAQRELFEQTSSRIYGLLLRMTGNPDDAFDLTQETYIRGFARIADFDERSSIITWLHRIAVNQALQFKRRRQMSNGKHREIAAGLPQGHHGNGRLMLRLDLETALKALSVADRAVLLLRYQSGYDYRTIAEILDVPAGTVASRLNRARDQLRSLLRESYGPMEETGQSVHRTIREGLTAQSDRFPACGEALD